MVTRVQPGESLLGARDRLIDRIARSAPPVRSFDGRLQAWRDAKDDDLECVWSGGEGLTSHGRV